MHDGLGGLDGPIDLDATYPPRRQPQPEAELGRRQLLLTDKGSEQLAPADLPSGVDLNGLPAVDMPEPEPAGHAARAPPPSYARSQFEAGEERPVQSLRLLLISYQDYYVRC